MTDNTSDLIAEAHAQIHHQPVGRMYSIAEVKQIVYPLTAALAARVVEVQPDREALTREQIADTLHANDCADDDCEGGDMSHYDWLADALIAQGDVPSPPSGVSIEQEWRKAIADQVRHNMTPTTEQYQAGGDALVYAVADWIENPPEWSKFVAPEVAEVQANTPDDAGHRSPDRGRRVSDTKPGWTCLECGFRNPRGTYRCATCMKSRLSDHPVGSLSAQPESGEKA